MLDINGIKEILPHRAPFLLIDKVEEIVPGEKVTAYKNVTYNEDFFRGHFPEAPVMPGVLIIEALAQTGAVALLSLDEFKGKIAYFGGIKNARFRANVVPGDVLKLQVEIIKRRGHIGIGKGVATVNGEVVCDCEFTFAVEQ